MNKYLYNIFLLYFLFIPNGANSCEGSDKEEPKYIFEDLKEGYEFAGVYEFPMALTGGESLYIFPNGKFALTYNCDICPEEEVLAKGTYSQTGSTIKLKYSSEYKGIKEKVYFIMYGYKEYEDYREVEANAPLLLDQSQLSEIASADSFYDYLHRVTPYPNWKKKGSKLLSKKITGTEL